MPLLAVLNGGVSDTSVEDGGGVRGTEKMRQAIGKRWLGREKELWQAKKRREHGENRHGGSRLYHTIPAAKEDWFLGILCDQLFNVTLAGSRARTSEQLENRRCKLEVTGESDEVDVG